MMNYALQNYTRGKTVLLKPCMNLQGLLVNSAYRRSTEQEVHR